MVNGKPEIDKSPFGTKQVKYWERGRPRPPLSQLNS